MGSEDSSSPRLGRSRELLPCIGSVEKTKWVFPKNFAFLRREMAMLGLVVRHDFFRGSTCL